MNDSPQIGLELSAELLNQRLEGYRVLREVGHGAMGIVFEARQRGLERRVAVKVLPLNLSLRDRTVRRFLREAEAMGRLSHTNIVDVYEVGSRGSLHYFAMRFVDGPPLDSVLKAGVLGIGDVLQIGIDVAGALAHAHSRGVLHRDVKPSNLLRDGERVVLTDFGLAKPIDSDDADAMTESGDMVGTPLYMSPEQILADSDGIDVRSDVWGLGATLYELLIGRPPFTGTNPQSILHAILHRDPALLRRQRADVPSDLEAVVLKCLEKDRSRRYSGAAGLHADLLAIQAGQSVSARPPRFIDPALRWTRRHPLQSGVLAIALVSLGLFGWQWNSSRQKFASSQKDLQDTELARKAAVIESAQEREERTRAIASTELLNAWAEWNRAKDNSALRLHALDRVAHLMNVTSFDQNPEMAIEITRVYAQFLHTLGEDDRALAEFDRLNGENASAMVLAMRGAMLEGMERFEEAFALHQRRAGLFPKAVEPWVDAALVQLTLAKSELAGLSGASTDLESQARGRLVMAVGMLDQALLRAVRAADENRAATVLIERARCLIELGQFALAEQNLRDALDHDSARADARALLQACLEGPAQAPDFTAESETLPAPGAAGDLAASADSAATPVPDPEAPRPSLGLPLVDRLTTPLDIDTADIADAGKNLQAIYSGLRKVLSKGAGANRTAPEANAPPIKEQQR